MFGSNSAMIRFAMNPNPLHSSSCSIWQAIPLPRLKVVLELAVGRLRDKSSLVRKNAVQLLTTLLTRNPFDATVSVYCTLDPDFSPIRRLSD